MSEQRKYSAKDVYAEYIRLRQGGTEMEDAIIELGPLTAQISRADLDQLATLVQDWELRYGKSYGAIAQKTGMKPAPVPGAASIQAATGRSASQSNQVICPKCHKPNRKEDSHCYACGEILQATKFSTRSFGDDEADAESSVDPSYFGPSFTLLLEVRGASEPLRTTVEKETVIGRSAPDVPIRPDIDLNTFDAENLGVSRLHASFNRQENTLTIMDMNSKNHTFINGQKLHPHEVRVLRHGDEIRLGKLPLRVAFKRQLKRIR